MKIIRWLLAAGCLVLCAWLVMGAMKAASKPADQPAGETTEEVTGALQIEHVRPLPYYVFAAVALIAAIALAAPDTIGIVCGAVGQLFSGAIFPESRESKPILSYTLARHYMNESRFDDAVEEYKKILRYYPEEKDAHVELLTAAAQCGDTRAYKKYARRLKRRFDCEIEVVYQEPGEVSEAGEEAISDEAAPIPPVQEDEKQA